MDTDKLFARLSQIEHIEDLDVLLDARERLRRAFTYLTDAFNTTGNPVFLDYRDQVMGAGQMVNEDIQRITTTIAMTKASQRFEGVGKPHAKGI
jgi:hypothetical protein